MAVLRSLFNVIPLSEAVARLKAHSLPSRAACVTFDDGYADNVTRALPILQHYQVPATFFVTSGYLGNGAMFNDVLIESVRHCANPVLDLSAIGLGIHQLVSMEARRQAIASLLGQIKYKSLPERQDLAQAVAHIARVTQPSGLMMTSEQVRQLHDAGMEIGGHTVHHPILASTDLESARQEIGANREALAAITGAPIRLFAYPNGKPGTDYRREHVDLVREAGFECAVSTAWGVATRQSDYYQLPRFTPWDIMRFRFALRLVRNLGKTDAVTV